MIQFGQPGVLLQAWSIIVGYGLNPISETQHIFKFTFSTCSGAGRPRLHLPFKHRKLILEDGSDVVWHDVGNVNSRVFFNKKKLKNFKTKQLKS